MHIIIIHHQWLIWLWYSGWLDEHIKIISGKKHISYPAINRQSPGTHGVNQLLHSQVLTAFDAKSTSSFLLVNGHPTHALMIFDQSSWPKSPWAMAASVQESWKTLKDPTTIISINGWDSKHQKWLVHGIAMPTIFSCYPSSPFYLCCWNFDISTLCLGRGAMGSRHMAMILMPRSSFRSAQAADFQCPCSCLEWTWGFPGIACLGQYWKTDHVGMPWGTSYNLDAAWAIFQCGCP